MGSTTADLTDQLRSWFGFADFRPGQREACEATLAGRDVLAIMPTGSGKSLCYQLPALIDGQLTLVVSPLIALMQDQYAALRARGLDGVEMIASSMSGEAVSETLARVRGGDVRLLYVAPERFSSRRFLEAIEAAGVRRLAIDEAHCLSEWGHDFRPDYLRLADVRTRLGSPPTIALTATATRRVAGDIVRALELRDPVTPSTGFDRPNLFFAVERVGSDAAKPTVLLELLQAPGALPAVVYCGRRATCEEVSAHLLGAGISAAPYHAGLAPGVRSETLESFLAGRIDVVAATTAFGMGIDKPNVRSVVHWAIPASPEEYYQQAGRAGRDGLPARCTLLYSGRDKGLIVFFINRAKMSPADLSAVHAELASRADPKGVFAVFERDVPAEDPRAALAVLERAGALDVFPAPTGSFSGRLADPRLDARHLNAAAVAMRQVENRRWERLKAIDAYATSDGCRRAALLGYFGERPEERPADVCCDGHGGRRAGTREEPVATPALATVDAVLLAVDETDGRVGRTRLAQILRGSQAKALTSAGHDRLRSHGALVRQSQTQVMGAIDRLIASGALEQTGGPYPLVRRAAAQSARTSREADLRSQVLALGTARDRAGIPFLTRVLASGDSAEVRKLAALALARIGDDSANDALTAALDDESPDVRNAAAAALRHISHVS